MKAMIINKFGSSDVFETAEIAKPEVKTGHVLVKVVATSVNTVDTMIRQLGDDLVPLAPALPSVLGMDFAGTVESIGEGVTEFKIGDDVYGCAGGLANLAGALAEYMLADEQLIAYKPKSISMREAAALPLVGITAYEGLVRAGVTKGQKVLVHSGSGGVGHVALQIANTNLIKFIPNSELCSMFNNKANLFRFSHSKSNKFNAVSGRRTSSQGRF
jgi:NADPH2:quinone reductase